MTIAPDRAKLTSGVRFLVLTLWLTNVGLLKYDTQAARVLFLICTKSWWSVRQTNAEGHDDTYFEYIYGASRLTRLRAPTEKYIMCGA